MGFVLLKHEGVGMLVGVGGIGVGGSWVGVGGVNTVGIAVGAETFLVGMRVWVGIGNGVAEGVIITVGSFVGMVIGVGDIKEGASSTSSFDCDFATYHVTEPMIVIPTTIEITSSSINANPFFEFID